MSLRAKLLFIALCWMGWMAQTGAQVTFSTTTSEDVFMATGSPDNPIGTDLTGENFGAAGTLAISPASADKGEFQSVIMFNLAGAVTLFNNNFGTNGWTVIDITLTLNSNYGIAGVQPNNGIFNVISGGNFVIEWLSNDDWAEGTGTPNLPTTDGVTYDSLPELTSGATAILCTNAYKPPETNNTPIIFPLPLNTNLVADITNGGNTTLLFYAADNKVGYLFNSHEYGRGNQPLINVTAGPYLEILSSAFTNGAFHLTAQGGANFQYQVQANTDLTTTNWQNLGTVTADGNGLIQFADTLTTNQQRFYRLSR